MKPKLLLPILVFVVVISYILIKFFNFKKDLFIYQEFTYKLIQGYGTAFRTEPDSIADFIALADIPNYDWNQYDPPYRTFDSTKMRKFLKKSVLKVEDDTLYIYLKYHKSKDKCCIKPEDYSLLDYLWSKNDILIQSFSFHHGVVANGGMYNLELFKDYRIVYDTIIKFHFSRKLRSFHQYHFNTHILPTFNLDSTTLFYHVKKVNDGFAWKVIYNPLNLSANKTDSIFQLIKTDYLNDSLTRYFDIINIPVIITANE